MPSLRPPLQQPKGQHHQRHERTDAAKETAGIEERSPVRKANRLATTPRCSSAWPAPLTPSCSTDVAVVDDVVATKLFLHPAQAATAALRSSADNADFLPANHARQWKQFTVVRKNRGLLLNQLNQVIETSQVLAVAQYQRPTSGGQLTKNNVAIRMFSWNPVFGRFVDAGAGTPDSVENPLQRRPVVGNGIVSFSHFSVGGEDYIIPAEFMKDIAVGDSHPFRQSTTVSPVVEVACACIGGRLVLFIWRAPCGNLRPRRQVGLEPSSGGRRTCCVALHHPTPPFLLNPHHALRHVPVSQLWKLLRTEPVIRDPPEYEWAYEIAQSKFAVGHGTRSVVPFTIDGEQYLLQTSYVDQE